MQAGSISGMEKQSFLLKVPRKRKSLLLGGLSERFTWPARNRFRSVNGLDGVETWVLIFYLGKAYA